MTTLLRVDPLTGCWLPGAITSMHRGSCIAMIDIVGFREINDVHGHAFGDSVLRAVGVRLREGLAPFRIYRSGGDEFLIEVDGPLLRHDAEGLAIRIIDLVGRPIDGLERALLVDVGVSLRRIEGDATAVRYRAEWAQSEARTRRLPFLIEGAAGEL